MRADDDGPRPLVSERAAHTPLSTLEDGSLSIFSLRWTRAARGAAARGTRAHATAHPPCGNADIFEYTEKAANFGTGLGWIQPRDRVFFCGWGGAFFRATGVKFLHVENHSG